MSVSLVKVPALGSFLTRTETGVAYVVRSAYAYAGHVHAQIQAPTGDGAFGVDTLPDAPVWHRLDTFRPATRAEIASWHRVQAINTDEADETDNECEGHESLAGGHMGETVYCDGTCK